MSLINDALKRTQDAAYQAAQTPPPLPTRCQPSDAANTQGVKRILLVMGGSAAVILVGFIVLILWLVPRIRSVGNSLTPATEVSVTEPKPAKTVTPPAPKVEAPAKPAVALPAAPAPSTPAPAQTDSKASEEQIVAKVMERIKTEQPAVPPPPKLALQGITYAPNSRDAMINGVTVQEGDVIEGARVVTIENRRVALDFHGQEIVLRLP
ncbi:MAG TPA: general secretion pathway protein GspB [Verrucomicrobiae bacterium]|nr:general secretion pathway protein GspB [Verrucomicrobiae bacterium]